MTNPMTTPAHLRAAATAMRTAGKSLEYTRPTDYEGVVLANELTAAAMRVMEYVERMERSERMDNERKDGGA